MLEYDAARKIAQGLGAHLENLSTLVQIKGETARLLAVAERAAFLSGQHEAADAQRRPRSGAQAGLFEEEERQLERKQGGDAGLGIALRPGATTLDRVHQAMVLFSRGQSDAVKRFLVEGGVGHDERFWRLAQALSQLYPTTTDEKRWIDGVLARKKGLGF